MSNTAGAHSVAQLLAQLKADDRDLRCSAALGLFRLKPDQGHAVMILTELTSAFADRDPAVRDFSAWAAGWHASVNESAMDLLLATAASEDFTVRRTMCHALVRIAVAVPRSIPVLIALLRDPKGYVRAEAVTALGAQAGINHAAGVSSPEIRAALTTALAEQIHANVYNEDERWRGHVVHALQATLKSLDNLGG